MIHRTMSALPRNVVCVCVRAHTYSKSIGFEVQSRTLHLPLPSFPYTGDDRYLDKAYSY